MAPLDYLTNLIAGNRAQDVAEDFVPNPSEDQRPPMAVAMEWVSRITTISLEMVLPGIFGQWLDQKWGTSFLALVGFALGITTAIWHLLAISKESQRGSRRPSSSHETNTKRPPDQPDGSGGGLK